MFCPVSFEARCSHEIYKLVGLCEKRYDVVNALEDCVADNLTVCLILKTKFSSIFSFELID